MISFIWSGGRKYRDPALPLLLIANGDGLTSRVVHVCPPNVFDIISFSVYDFIMGLGPLYTSAFDVDVRLCYTNGERGGSCKLCLGVRVIS